MSLLLQEKKTGRWRKQTDVRRAQTKVAKHTHDIRPCIATTTTRNDTPKSIGNILDEAIARKNTTILTESQCDHTRAGHQHQHSCILRGLTTPQEQLSFPSSAARTTPRLAQPPTLLTIPNNKTATASSSDCSRCLQALQNTRHATGHHIAHSGQKLAFW